MTGFPMLVVIPRSTKRRPLPRNNPPKQESPPVSMGPKRVLQTNEFTFLRGVSGLVFSLVLNWFLLFKSLAGCAGSFTGVLLSGGAGGRPVAQNSQITIFIL
eukprot:3012210-Lingulodinium_polyedra.AAC.1